MRKNPEKFSKEAFHLKKKTPIFTGSTGYY